MKILLVDDSRSTLVMTRRTLNELGFTDVTLAQDALVALDLIRTDRPDLIIADLNMPGMNGFELLVAVQDQFGAIPIFFLTASHDVVAHRRLRDAGATWVFKKPLKAELFSMSLDSIETPQKSA
ncbi:MAG: response regulator [Myxococcota bacterium]